MLLYFIHTSEGAKVGSYCFLYGDVRERKAMLKSMKEHVSTIVYSPYAYLVVLVALATVDDTSLASKSLLVPLVPHLYQIARHSTASRTLISLLVAPSTRNFNQQEINFMTKAVLVPNKEKEGEKAEMVPASLKNPTLRRQQLLDSISEPLMDMCTVHTHNLVASKFGAELIHCMYQVNKSPILKAVHNLVESTDTSPELAIKKQQQEQEQAATKDVDMKEATAPKVGTKEATDEDTSEADGNDEEDEEGSENEEGESEDEAGDIQDEEDEDEGEGQEGDEEQNEDENENDDKDDGDDDDDDDDDGDDAKDEENQTTTADGNQEEGEEDADVEYWKAASGTRLMSHLMKEDATLVKTLANAFKGAFAYWANQSSNASYLIRDILLTADQQTRDKVLLLTFSSLSPSPPFS